DFLIMQCPSEYIYNYAIGAEWLPDLRPHKRRTISSVTDKIASLFENKSNSKKSPKGRRKSRNGKGKQSQGTKIAPQSPVLEAESDVDLNLPISDPVLLPTQKRMTISSMMSLHYSKSLSLTSIGLIISITDTIATHFKVHGKSRNSSKERGNVRKGKGKKSDGKKKAPKVPVLKVDSDEEGTPPMPNPVVHSDDSLTLAVVIHAFCLVALHQPFNDRINTDVPPDPRSAFTNLTHDYAEGFGDIDGRDVTQALDSIIIRENDIPVNNGIDVTASRLEKRKRTLSQASHQKKDGGRGTPKRVKQGSETNAWDDPIQTNTKYNDTLHKDATQQSSSETRPIQSDGHDKNDTSTSISADQAGSSSPVILCHMDTIPELLPTTTIIIQPKDTSSVITALHEQHSGSVGSTFTNENATQPRVNSYHNCEIELVEENDPPPYVSEQVYE
ncbi:uncharacterized protein F5147DRAFT_660648, partial [Suillus discolor]